MTIFEEVAFKNIKHYVCNPKYTDFTGRDIFEPMTSIVVISVNIAKIIDVHFAEYILTHLLNCYEKIEDDTFKKITETIDNLMNYPKCSESILHVVTDKSIVIKAFNKLNLITVMDLSRKANEIMSSTDTDENKMAQFSALVYTEICNPTVLELAVLSERMNRPIQPKKIDINAFTLYVNGHEHSKSSNKDHTKIDEPWTTKCLREYTEIMSAQDTNKIMAEMDWFDYWSPQFMQTFGLPPESTNTNIMLELLDFDFSKIKQNRTEIIEDHFTDLSKDHQEDHESICSDNELYEPETLPLEDYSQLIIEYSDITNEAQKKNRTARWKHILDDFADDPDDALAQIISVIEVNELTEVTEQTELNE